MPKPTNSNVGGNATTSNSRRFQLPALDFKFGSLTEGTNIPPPLPSPVEEKAPTPPKTPSQEPIVSVKKEEKTNGHVNGSENSPNPLPSYVGVKRPAEDGPASPTGSSRGSLRRLLSKSLLNKTYDEQVSSTSSGPPQAPAAAPPQNIITSRPPSRTASTMTEERKSKRSSGWFRRLRNHDNDSNKRMSQQFLPVAAPKSTPAPPPKPAGPPPPMIPELSALETKVDTNIGDDIFKAIK